MPENEETPQPSVTTDSGQSLPSGSASAGERQLLQEELAQTKQQLQTVRQEWEDTKRELQQRNRQVRLLASELVLTEQRIRQEIAQALHDELQQLLFAAQVQVKFVSQSLASHPEATAYTDIKQVKEMLDEALRLTRRLTLDISPILLHGQDAAAVMSELAEQMQEMHGLDVELHISAIEEILEADMQQLILQVVRELLFNVVKHAGVRRAMVQMLWEADHLIIQVADKGQGFEIPPDWQTSPPEHSYGLRSISERLALFGGRIDVISSQSQGTTVTIKIPTREIEP